MNPELPPVRFKQAVVLFSAGLMATSLLALPAWLLGREALINLGIFNGAPLSPTATINFFLIGMATLLLAALPLSGRGLWFVRTLLASILALSLFPLWVYLTRPAFFFSLIAPYNIITFAPFADAGLVFGALGLLLFTFFFNKTIISLANSIFAAFLTFSGSFFVLWHIFNRPVLISWSAFPPGILASLALTVLGLALLALFLSYLPFTHRFFESNLRTRLMWSFVPLVLGISLTQSLVNQIILPEDVSPNYAARLFTNTIVFSVVYALFIWALAWRMGGRIEKAQAERLESEERYRSLFENMLEGLVLYEPVFQPGSAIPTDFIHLAANPAFDLFAGIPFQTIQSRAMRQVFPQAKESTYSLYQRVYSTGQPETFDVFSEALQRHFHASTFRLPDGKIATLFSDETEQVRRREAMQVLLGEKEVLLKEVHHRVKNNLQIIISLLSLRAENIQDPVAAQSFLDCQNSVRAIALVHERIYQLPSLTSVDLGEYLENIVEYLATAHSISAQAIAVEFHSAPLTVDIDRAITCGLITTELFTNAVKHAFPQMQPGQRIRIDLQTENNAHRLTLSDNGIGIPESFNLESPTSMGLQLTQLLAKKLRGHLSLSRTQPGTTFILDFPP